MSRFAIALCACIACSASPSARGITWSKPIEIAAGGGQRGPWRQNDSQYDYVDDPSVALGPDGAAYVVWVDHRPKDVLFQIYEAGKPRFAQPVNVSRTPRVFSWLPRVVLSPGHPREVFVLWQEIVFSGGSHGGEAYFARSLDGGATFGEPVNLSRSMGGDGKARIDRERWHNGSLDLAIAGDGTLHAAWTEYDGPLWYSRSIDRGETFGAPVQLAGDAERPARAPALAIGKGDTVHLAWTTGEDASADIQLATSADAGRTFGAPVVVERTPTYSDAPKLAVDAVGTLHVAYAESAGGPFDRYHVRYTRSRDGGDSFERPRVIASDDAASLSAPALALDDRRVVVLWEHAAAAQGYARGLGIAMSRDGGDTFGKPEMVDGSRDPGGGNNGSHQGRLMRKLDARGGTLAVVNSALAPNRHSRVWLVIGRPR